MLKYLLLKLAEEAGEVVVAAVKYRLHKSPVTAAELEQEVGDFLGVLRLLTEQDDTSVSTRNILRHTEARYAREKKRAKRR